MFAVGHLSLGYLTGKATSKILKTDANIPLLLVLFVLPDIDLLIPSLRHRGPTHSIILFSLLFIPFFALYRKKAAPYFIALVQHSLLSDFIAGGGTQLLWPLTPNLYGIQIEIRSLTNIAMEWFSFLLFLTVMLGTKEVNIFFQDHSSNLLLSIPLFTALLPTLLKFPTYVPLELVAPHLVYSALFTIPILIDLKVRIRTRTVPYQESETLGKFNLFCCRGFSLLQKLLCQLKLHLPQNSGKTICIHESGSLTWTNP